ncbi:LysR family transcriptional regulator [Telmatospirillum siberiense]|nr:LysR family transcriptional regulator [Telmatospirillum siberiense]
MMSASLPSIDQITTFLAVVEHGNFSAAAKMMNRPQSSVTYAIQKLETDLGITLFDRSARLPILTTEGRALVPMARRLALEMRTLQRSADSMAQGIERKLLLAVDCAFPTARLIAVLARFNREFPIVRARITIDSLHAVAMAVVDGTATLGIAGPVIAQFPELASHPIGMIARVPVAAPDHPLGLMTGPIPPEAFREQVQIVMANASRHPRQRMFNSPEGVIWRINDMGFKKNAILSGLAWGRLPLALARADLDAGRLVRLEAEGVTDSDWCRPLPMHLAYRRDDILGPAARWIRQALMDDEGGTLPGTN